MTRNLRKALFVAALTLPVSAALAAEQGPVTVNVRGVTMLASPPVRPFVQPAKQEPGLVKIFDNMLPAKTYPYGRYFCCIAPGIMGPANQYNSPEEWWAESFTPAVNATVTKIEVAVAWAGGTNSVNIGLYSDSGDMPGTPLYAKDVKNLPPTGSCCTTMSLKDKDGIPVTAGTQYWVVVSTDSADTDFAGAWNYNTSDQVTKINQAEYANSTWSSGPIAPGVGLAVWGK